MRMVAVSACPVSESVSMLQPKGLRGVGKPAHPTDSDVKYYVYDEYPFNWFEVCSTDFDNEGVPYSLWKTSTDYWLGVRALNESDPWRVRDPKLADVFIVPALLTVSHIMEEACQMPRYKMLNDLELALAASEFFQSEKPHLIEASRWCWADYSNYSNIERLLALDFENRTLGKENKQFLLGGMVGKQCGAQAVLGDTPGWESSKHPLLFHFAGSIKNVVGDVNRQQLCDAIGDMDAWIKHSSICVSSAKPANLMSDLEIRRLEGRNNAISQDDPGPCVKAFPHRAVASVYETQCDGTMVSCNVNPQTFDYCGTLARSKFLLFTPGDTWNSNRLFDGIENGVVPVLMSRQQLSILPFASEIPWEDMVFVLDNEQSYSPDDWRCNLNHTSPDSLRQALSELAGVPSWRLKQMRQLILQHRSKLSWSAPGSTTLHTLLRVLKKQFLQDLE